MSYARRQRIGASRTFAIAIVALTQASLGYALVNGFAYTATHEAAGGLKTFNVEELQPPPPERPRKPKLAPKQLPERAPPPSARINAALPPASPTLSDAPPLEVAMAAAPAPPASAAPAQWAPSPPVIEKAAPRVAPRSATGDLQSLFRPADYPLKAIEHAEHGSVTVQLTVGTMGRVSACDVTSSSGSRSLDDASCQILRRRALFTPARDSSGNLAIDTVRQEILWVLR